MGTNQERLDPLAYADRDECLLHLMRYFFAADTIGKLMATHPVAKILDAACGLGYGTEILKRNHPTVEVVGLDNDEKAIQHCRTLHTCLGVQYIQQDIMLCPTADAIVCLETLEHLSNWQEAFSYLQGQSSIFIFSVPWKQLCFPTSKQFHRAFGLYDESFADLILPGSAVEWYAQHRYDFGIHPLNDVQEPQRSFLIGIICRKEQKENGAKK